MFDEDREEPDDECDLGFLNDGRPTKMHLGNAIQVIVHCRTCSYPGGDPEAKDKHVTVRQVAQFLNTPEERIAEAVECHPWLFLSRDEGEPLGDAWIEEDGE